MQEPTMTMNTKEAMLDVMNMFDGTIQLDDLQMENTTESLPVKGVMFVSAALPITDSLALITRASIQPLTLKVGMPG
jgi:hypothetical protein